MAGLFSTPKPPPLPPPVRMPDREDPAAMAARLKAMNDLKNKDSRQNTVLTPLGGSRESVGVPYNPAPTVTSTTLGSGTRRT